MDETGVRADTESDPGDAAGCVRPDPSTLEGTAPAVTVTLPAVDKTYGTVGVTDLPGEKSGSDLVDPIHVGESSVSSSHRHPQVLRLWIDQHDAPGTTPSDVDVYGFPDGTGGYGVIPPCTSSGKLASSKSSCVDRRTSQTRTIGDTIVVVVRTVVVNSRWVGR